MITIMTINNFSALLRIMPTATIKLKLKIVLIKLNDLKT